MDYFLIAIASLALGYLLPKLRGPTVHRSPKNLGPHRLSGYHGNPFHEIRLGLIDGKSRPNEVHARYLLTGGHDGCRHTHEPEIAYTRIDSTLGPGWLSDSYQGAACACCGTILQEEKVY